jgi:lipid A ethanolaminephosphotransferase
MNLETIAADRRSPARRLRRPEFSPLLLTIATGIFLFATANHGFWSRLLTQHADHPALTAAMVVLGFATLLFSIAVLALPGLVRPALALCVVIGAAAAWFQDRLGVVIDREMLQNALNTTGNESRHLLSPGMIAHLVIWGLLPAALILWVRVKPLSPLRHGLHYLAGIVLPLALFAAGLASDYKGISSLIREDRALVASLVPTTALSSALRMAKLKLITQNLVAAPIGLDAQNTARARGATKPTLTVIVVGETSRVANWSLGGYGRPTNPNLAQRDIVFVNKLRSCGTSTAVSMPCMFAHYGMENHSQTASRSYQNLLDVLKQTGMEVSWFDNNTGSLGVADRITEVRINPADDSANCDRGECTDGAFLPILDKVLAEITKDTVLVLHQIGSHGPAYYLRYPDAFRPFANDCRSADFSRCSSEEILNAYDNSIAYTDLNLSQMIDMLGATDRALTSLLYVSDHGESLGENGIYLHAAPYFMAPVEQTEVPLVLWTAPDYRATFGLDQGCISSKVQGKALTHDTVFHTVLGLANVTTALHNRDLDLTAGCNGQP